MNHYYQFVFNSSEADKPSKESRIYRLVRWLNEIGIWYITKTNVTEIELCPEKIWSGKGDGCGLNFYDSVIFISNKEINFKALSSFVLNGNGREVIEK